MRRALLLMEQNLARPIAVAAVAAELGLSARQLERLCRQHVGMGPASLYRQLRMRYANWLIENTDRSVTDIANEAGFADCAHFSRQFKDAYGLSPSTRRLQPQRAVNGDAAGARHRDRSASLAARILQAADVSVQSHAGDVSNRCPSSGIKRAQVGPGDARHAR